MARVAGLLTMTATPSTFTPYPFQQRGIRWLAKRDRALLADDQGLGKTFQTIHAAKRLKPRRVLCCVPLNVLWNWPRELERWAPGARVQVISTGKDNLDPDAEWVIVTHSLPNSAWVFDQLTSVEWDLLVVDECHFFINPDSLRSHSVFGLGCEVSLAHKAQRIWLLSGTPMLNHPGELYTALAVLAPERLTFKKGPHKGKMMDRRLFRLMFTVQVRTKRGPKPVAARNPDKLRAMLDGIMLRRLKSRVLKQLPQASFHKLTMRPKRVPWELEELSEFLGTKFKQRLAEELEENRVEEIDEAQQGFSLLGAKVELARFRKLTGIAKVECAVDLIAPDLKSGALDKVVLFAYHLDAIAALVEQLSEFGAFAITGSVSGKKRDQLTEQFQDPDGPYRVAVGQIKAAGTGITLTAASEAVFVEMSFVPGENIQAADRVLRIGQTRAVRVRFISLAGTADEKLTEILRRKAKMIHDIVRPTE